MKKGKGNSEKREGWGRGKVGRGKGGKWTNALVRP